MLKAASYFGSHSNLPWIYISFAVSTTINKGGQQIVNGFGVLASLICFETRGKFCWGIWCHRNIIKAWIPLPRCYIISRLSPSERFSNGKSVWVSYFDSFIGHSIFTCIFFKCCRVLLQFKHQNWWTSSFQHHHGVSAFCFSTCICKRIPAYYHTFSWCKGGDIQGQNHASWWLGCWIASCL